jgi:signal recognition particle subunit SRP54
MFDALTDKFEGVFKRLRGEMRLSEENIREAMRDVRVALLDADVNFRVAKDFIKAVTDKAVGEETLKAVRPGQQVIRIVHDELVAMLGGAPAEFTLQRGQMQVILLLGLQGSGKTTFAGKLAKFCEAKGGFKPLLIACDIYRPAAIEQLHVVGKRVGAPVFDMGDKSPVTEIAAKGIEKARAEGRDLVIIDTAGRLHIDEVKMDELVGLKKSVEPKYTFLVADAMTGQDAVQSATAFHEGVGIVCLTKIDGDARGGAALSIRAVTGRPIVFVGVGERPEDLEPFYPDRVASRILGMGDVLSLVEKAQAEYDATEAIEMQRKLKREEFTLQDFLDQMQKVKKMGSMKSLLKMIPGLGQMTKDMEVDDEDFKPMEAIIRSMTPEERANIELLDGSRKKRIAKGSGTTPADINTLVQEFRQTRSMMGQVMRMSGAPNGKQSGGGGAPAATPAGARQRGGGGGPGPIKNKPKHRRKRKTKKNTKKGRRR